MDWNCTLTEERLSDVLDRTLSPRESATFLAHAGQCKRCARLAAQVGGIVSELRQLPWLDEPPFLSSKILARTREIPRFAWSPAMWQTRFVMGIVTVAATFLIIFHAVGVGTPEKFRFSPASLYRDANRRIHLTYARGVRFVNDLRVVYEIESRLSSQPPALGPRPHSDARPKSETAPFAEGAFRRELAGLETQNETSRSIP
jgi:anti-sigma factor RsiW